jgi:hypothetical protein
MAASRDRELIARSKCPLFSTDRVDARQDQDRRTAAGDHRLSRTVRFQ